MPKSRVTCVMQRCDTSEKHQSSSVPIFQPNVSNFSTFQFWSLSIVGSFSVFCLSSELCFTIKTQKKRKNFPLSVFREVIYICLSFAFRCQIPSLLCVGTLASSLFNRKLRRTFTQTSCSCETLGVIVAQNQESNAILRQKNNLKLYYENNLQKTKSKP